MFVFNIQKKVVHKTLLKIDSHNFLFGILRN